MRKSLQEEEEEEEEEEDMGKREERVCYGFDMSEELVVALCVMLEKGRRLEDKMQQFFF